MPGSGETPHSSVVLGVLEPVDVLARGAVVAGDGQLEDAVAVLELEDVLDRPLAVGPLADDRGPVVVLEAGRDDLGGRGRVLVDQDDHREVFVGPVLLGLVGLGDGVAPSVLTILPVVQEQVGDLDRRAEQAAGVVAEVEDQALGIPLP